VQRRRLRQHRPRGRCPEHTTEQRKQNRSVNDGFYGSLACSRRQELFDHPLCQYVMQDGSELPSASPHSAAQAHQYSFKQIEPFSATREAGFRAYAGLIAS
jgi:hypothetical protein